MAMDGTVNRETRGKKHRQLLLGKWFLETWQWKIQFRKKPLLHEFKGNCKIISTLSKVSGFNPFEKTLVKMDHFCKVFW